MRIEGYSQNSPPLKPAAHKPAIPAKPAGETAAAAGSEAAELSPHERLRQLLEQKRWLAEAAFADSGPEPELGKHIDLRV